MKQIAQKKRRVTITETTYEQPSKGGYTTVSASSTKFETDITGKWLKGKTPLDFCKGNCDRIVTVREAEAEEKVKMKEAANKQTSNRFTSSSTATATKYVTSSTTGYPAKQMVKWRLKVDEFHIGEIVVPMSVDRHDAMEMILGKANSVPDIEPKLIQMMPELIYHKSLATQYK